MKIIFSRKGFDTEYGKDPSPIIDGQSISLPIPYANSTKSFESAGYGKYVADLTENKIKPDDLCHPDPDLNMGAFGQQDRAQAHLRKQDVQSGDLFLFFGSFREAQFNDDVLCYIRGAKEHHRIFGWLFIEKIVNVGSDTAKFRQNYPEYSDHPHAIGTWKPNSTIYIAPKTFDLFDERQVSGFGKFRATEETILTCKQAPSKSYWRVPDWLNPEKGGCIPSYHKEKNYRNGLLKTAGRGQEFVCQPAMKEEFKDWLLNLFEKST